MLCALAPPEPTNNALRIKRARRRATPMSDLETVRVVARYGPQRRRSRPHRGLSRDDRTQLGEKEFLDVSGTLAQRGISRANDFLVFANIDRVLHPTEGDRRIE